MSNFSLLLPSWLEIAIYAARAAGKILENYWGKLHELQIKEKSSTSDLVTEADKQSEQSILAILSQYFPTHKILAEESGYNQIESDFVWVIDPLDGTTNYTHQYPLVAISIGLLYQGRAILGVVYNPITKEMFTGVEGNGARLNGSVIQVSRVTSLNKSLLATGFSYDRNFRKDNNYAEFCHLTDLSQGVRRGGAASLDLAYVAAGRLDGYWELGLKVWDVVAGSVIVCEAGGQVSNYDLSSIDFYSGKILATNGKLQKIISEILIT